VLGVQADEFQQLLHRLAHPAGRVDALDPERGTDDGADGVPRVQRRVRVLEDHLDVPAQRAHPARGQVGDVAPVEDDRSGGRLE
jgi:hypothetical protein